MKNNIYFTTMTEILNTYEAARRIRKAERDAYKAADDWDSVKAFDKREEENFPFPYTTGEMNAYRAWEESIDNESSRYEVKRLPWDRDAHDFIECLRMAGFTEFAVTDESTALMRLLHIFCEEEGCRMAGLCKVTRSENRWGEEGTEDYDGILISL